MTTKDTFNFLSAFKVYPLEGNLVYEYNPFYNYRLDRDMIKYEDRLWDLDEFADEFNVKYDPVNNVFKNQDNKTIEKWDDIIPATKTPPVLQLKGSLTDFETDELSFSINNPVEIIPQYSYDDSVNLIINDGLNPPRLINSRFSATEKNKYLVCNRKGNNDSNIYDLGILFDTDTSLYKKIANIPELSFIGVSYGGNLSIGNYHFYFRYVDDDGNYSDFFAESGLVSIFIGNSANSIHTGFRNENAHKLVKFAISNTDPGYNKIVIYYTKSTADINENATVSAYRIDREYLLSLTTSTIVTITGFEEVNEVDLTEINTMYLIYGSAAAQATAQNMLFLGNVDRPKLPYEDLADCALRFLPYLDTTETYNNNAIGNDYTGNISNTYYDTNYIYNKVGYHDDEIYRFGVVFILSDNTLSEVFNVRGALNITTSYNNYTDIDFYNKDTGERNYINYDELYYNIINNNIIITSDEETTEETTETYNLENAKGVVSISKLPFNKVIGIRFAIKEEVINYLISDLKIKGFFFVRLKRIPTTICQAYTIGIDKQSNTPVLPLTNYYITESFLTLNEAINEDTITDCRLLSHDVFPRLCALDDYEVRLQGAICPEYDINAPYLNTLFTGSDFVCLKIESLGLGLSSDYVHYVSNRPTATMETSNITAKIIGVEDNVKLVAINNDMFSARAGEAEEAFRYEYIGKENKDSTASNLLRGSYGPYLGIVGYETAGDLIAIKIPGYSEANMQEYFEIRYHDKSPFYAISYRYDLSRRDRWSYTEGKYFLFDNAIYRGDCYICLFTHRLNRNFQDPTSPTNDKIVDPKCWKDHYEVNDGVVNTTNFDEINLGDVNAVRLGLYITLFVRSTYNLNIRSLDDSITDEVALFGHARGFYPYLPMSNSGSYKIPESLCWNKGFEKSLSERINFEVPDVPWIKNEFSNRIAYSDVQIKDAFSNGWRTFLGTHYRDYPKTYGSIIKLVELQGNLLCVFEHGVALIPINERAVAGEGSGGNVYINTSNVLPENPKVLSHLFGSLWSESIIKTPYFVYGVDTVARKIWKTDGVEFECISDFKIAEFLNLNISLTERELTPIIGIRNVKSHYNAFKLDVMFTFYDNLNGFEEKVWNICYNEPLQKWITFYSWVPSYSENIDNIYFSFDRNTSKWISKLGISDAKNDFSDGITLSNNVIPNDAVKGYVIGDLSLSNRILPTGTGIEYEIIYTLERDNFKNYLNFEIVNNLLVLKAEEAKDLLSEIYYKKYEEKDADGNVVVYLIEPTNEHYNLNLDVYKDDRGRRVQLPQESQKNPDKIVILLNVRATIKTTGEGQYVTGWENNVAINAGYYESTIAVIPKYNMLFLTTDFWKHGQAGIIDITDPILPTYWYGKLHPFEFEFIVADNPDKHKIFNNLQIISNSAEPESFHYEIVGDVFDFAKDKKNMYIRLEATKELYLYNGCDITYDHNYANLTSEHRPLKDSNGNEINGYYDKSTLMPLYYSRLDTINEIEDYYHLKDGKNTRDFSALAGGEITYYKTLDEYRIWNHTKAVNMLTKGRLRGNMQYNEDKWLVLINPINIVLKNEKSWNDVSKDIFTVPPKGKDPGFLRTVSANKIPIEIGLSPIPDEVLQKDNLSTEDIPENSQDRAIITWDWTSSLRSEVKLKDKWIKIRIRYTGDRLVIIHAIKTLYAISYA